MSAQPVINDLLQRPLTLAEVNAAILHQQRNRIKQYYPETGPLRRELYRKHMEFFRSGRQFRERLMMAANRTGKALKNGTPVATPTGWVPIEQLKPGDAVIAGDGSVTAVIGVYPQGVKPMLRLTFDVGEQIECCEEHLWVYQHPRARYPYRRSNNKTEANPFYGEWSVANTRTIRAQVGGSPIPGRRVVMPTCGAWQITHRPVPLDPYFLGVLLGNGGLNGYVRVSTPDQEILDAIRKVLPTGVALKPCGGKCDWVIATPSGKSGGPGSNPVRNVLKELGVADHRSPHKRVPDLYKFNSPDVRLAVLQGLMDTDGSINKTGAMEFSSTSEALAQDVAFLVHSLGGKCSIQQRQTSFTYKDERKQGLPSYRVRIRLNICPFRLKRKAERWHPRRNTPNRVLHQIENSEPAPCTCIEVAHPSHTYVTAHGIVTHNTESIGAYETTLHLTGRYPDWWPGYRFDCPISAWVAGDTNQTVRDILQAKLLGKLVREPGDNPNQAVGLGTGMIPWDAIKSVKPKAGGIPNAIESVFVKHVSGGLSELTFKSYEQGRESFQGTEKHLVWLDEEPPLDVYLECLVRTMQTTMFPGGLLILTFTPLNGWTDVVERFMDEKACAEAGRFMVQAGWDDAPHLSDAEKAAMLAALPPHQRDARSKGIPQLGAGAIYPVEESALIVQPFEIPPHWPRVFGMDVGWNWTAGVHAAWDRENDIVYLYAEYLRSEGEPSIHAAAIKSRGAWIPGVIDPAANGRSQVDGRQLLEMYKALGLDLEAADNAVEAGIYEVWTRMSSGRLKVFASCQQWLEEFRLYRRDEKGRVVKKRDHLMDCCVSGDTLIATSRGFVPIQDLVGVNGFVLSRSGSWARFYGARKTIELADVVRLTFSDGSTVVCTPDHPFLTPNGWRKAEEMQGYQCYNGISQCNHVSHWKYGLFRKAFKNLKAFATTVAESISSVMGYGFIGGYGRLQTVQSHTGMMSTIATQTGPITNSRTLNSSPATSTSEITIPDIDEACHSKPSRPLSAGILPMPAENGTNSTTRNSRISFTQQQILSAGFAASPSRQKTPEQTASAQTTARPKLAERLVWTTRNALAWFVASILWRIATLRKPHARASAMIRCLQVSAAGKRDVYCLTVPATSSFCLANGAVVHNTRYIVKSGLGRAKTEPVAKPKRPRVYDPARMAGSWMS